MLRLPSTRHALLALLASAAACGCAGEGRHDRTNVLLVVVDTARADKFGCYGHPGGLTPRIDALAAEGVCFQRAVAHAPWTLPSTASLLTSLHPEQHGAGGFLDLAPLERGEGPRIAFRPLAEEVQTVTESFRSAGWRTGAIVNVDFLDEGFGLTQGVDDLDARWYESNQEVRSATQTTDLALDWLAEHGDEPFFLLAHYFDAHAVYEPPKEFRERFAAPQDRADSNFIFGTRSHMLLLRAGKLELDAGLIERAERLYEAELAYVDEQVGRLVAGLADNGLDQNTLVVVTADHGEEFLEHGGFEHGHSLYDELVRVPLVLRLPGTIAPDQRLGGTAGLLDVAPTICDLVGLDVPNAFQGHSLVEAIREGKGLERGMLAHGNFWGEPLASWESGGWKLIMTPVPGGEPRVELYDLLNDPEEQRDLAASNPDDVERLRSEYEAVREHLAASAHGSTVELSEETQQRLKALGYLGSDDEPNNENGAE